MSRRVVGLKNLGNSCYLNAVLQSLASSSSFHLFLAENSHHTPYPSTFVSGSLSRQQSVMSALKRTLGELSLSHGSSIEPPLAHTEKITNSYVAMKEQQDAHEFMQTLMMLLEDEAVPCQQLRTSAPSLADAVGTVTPKASLAPRAPPSLFTSALLHSSMPHSLFLPHISMPSARAYSTSTPMSIPAAKPSHMPFGINRGKQLDESSDPSIKPTRLKSEKGKRFPSNPFSGLIASTIRCKSCGSESKPQLQRFVDLSLSLPDAEALAAGVSPCCDRLYTLAECLDVFTRQPIEGVMHPSFKPSVARPKVSGGDPSLSRAMHVRFPSQGKRLSPDPFSSSPPLGSPLSTSPLSLYAGASLLSLPGPSLSSSPPSCEGACKMAGGTCDALQSLTIARPPKCLCLHIRRLVGGSDGFVKLENPVQFPVALDLSKYCKTGLENIQCSCQKHRALPKPDNDLTNTCQIMYKLVAVIVHSGSATGGHFIVYRRLVLPAFDSTRDYEDHIKSALAQGSVPGMDLADQRWACISDERYNLVDEDEVLRSNAYMLFYEKCSDAGEIAQLFLRQRALDQRQSNQGTPGAAREATLDDLYKEYCQVHGYGGVSSTGAY
eukprot:TRINITY_DN3533_c0_g1_i2.p1 TRINITY_DN3533_c0_g1~~TRINITY_DN3533_c0_g1_i2.p1  ORF type:complete len:607 (-),score=83.76 TRINITY_DN3533_c0_g1_i2:33-1853(-)